MGHHSINLSNLSHIWSCTERHREWTNDHTPAVPLLRSGRAGMSQQKPEMVEARLVTVQQGPLRQAGWNLGHDTGWRRATPHDCRGLGLGTLQSTLVHRSESCQHQSQLEAWDDRIMESDVMCYPDVGTDLALWSESGHHQSLAWKQTTASECTVCVAVSTKKITVWTLTQQLPVKFGDVEYFI